MTYPYHTPSSYYSDSQSTIDNRKNINDALSESVKNILNDNVDSPHKRTDSYTKKLGLVISILK